MTIRKLSHLQPGDVGIINALHTNEEPLLRRLTTIGFRIGQRIEVIRSALAKGPLHIRLGTTELMLRRNEAQKIDVMA